MGESHSTYLLSGITVFTAESTLNDVKSQQSVCSNILISWHVAQCQPTILQRKTNLVSCTSRK